MTPIAEGNPGRGKHPFRQSHPTPRDHRRSRGVDGDPKRTGVFRPAHVTRVGRVHLDHAHAEARRAGVDHGLEQAVGERAQRLKIFRRGRDRRRFRGVSAVSSRS